MLDWPPGETEFLSWLFVIVWSVIIFVTIPFGPGVAGYVTKVFGSQAITVTQAIVAVAAMAVILRLLIKRGRTDTAGYMWFAATACLLIALITWLKSPSPAESFHYLEYGFLGFLLFRALSHRVRDYSIYALAVLIGTLIGTADEIIQWLTPGRYFEFADIGFNFTGVTLAQVMLAATAKPVIISGWPDVSGVRRVCCLAAALLMVLGLCLSIPA